MTGAQLWAKDQPLDAAIHAFTVGDDPVLDLQLLPWDCLGSAAHARMLGAIGVLDSSAVAELLRELQQLHRRAVDGDLLIEPAMEDGHTLIETELTRVLGDSGARIHTGRSRNDQVTLAQNLWLREQVLRIQQAQLDLAAALLAFARTWRTQQIPGYSHLQRAMPSSFGQWAAAFAEALLEEVAAGCAVRQRLDHCPLGAAAGFGVPLPLDRDLVARLLGYRRVHVSPIDAIAGRLRHAQAAADWCLSSASILERLAWDLSLFSSSEFGFVRLGTAFTTGSSIMPQKRNPDVVELLRAQCRRLRGVAVELNAVGGGLPSGYHRDFQLSKGPLLQIGTQTEILLGVAERVLAAVEIQPGACAAALSPELYATAAAYALVREGVPFRQAYREVALALAEGRFVVPESSSRQVSLGAPERLGLSRLRSRWKAASRRLTSERQRLAMTYSSIWNHNS